MNSKEEFKVLSVDCFTQLPDGKYSKAKTLAEAKVADPEDRKTFCVLYCRNNRLKAVTTSATWNGAEEMLNDNINPGYITRVRVLTASGEVLRIKQTPPKSQ